MSQNLININDINNDNDNSTVNNNSYENYLSLNNNLIKFNFKNVTEREVKNVILQLKFKNSSGIDGISSKIIKAFRQTFAKPISLIIN